MTDRINSLKRRMTAAAEALDFEEARRLRDEINLIRGGASPQDAESADTSILTRQKTGAMGLGTNHAKPLAPAGWRPPPKPNLKGFKVSHKRR